MNKKIIIAILLIFTLLSLQTVYAEDINLNSNNTALIIDDEIEYNLTENNHNNSYLPSNIIYKQTTGSFTELQNLINDDTTGNIILTKNYTYDESQDSTLKNGININKQITIDGAGFTINGNNQARIFNIIESYVKILNINLINANTNGNGGAINVNGNNLTIYFSNFTKNIATNHGGAVYLEGSENSTFINCTFNHNSAGYNGGAVDWHEGATNGSIWNSTFINNTANRSGGAVFWFGTWGGIINSNFYNNSALGLIKDADGSGGDGGAVIWSGHDGYITHCEFSNNTAERRGGAVYLKDNDNTIFNFCLFEHNSAGENGGAVDWLEGATNGRIHYSTFINNSATNEGGAVFWNGVNGTIQSCQFIDNDVTGRNSYGGAICWTGSNGLVKNTIFINNTAVLNGGAVNLRNNTNGSFINCTFIINYAGQDGGALYWRNGAVSGYVANSTFINNTAKRNAGAIEWQGENGTIENSDFENNTALGDVYGSYGYGGSVYWSGNNGLINTTTFNNNEAKRSGSAVYLLGDNCTAAYSTFNNNKANISAALYCTGADDHVEYCNFTNNTSHNGGGALYWNEGKDDDSILGCRFENNNAPIGGAVYWSRGGFGGYIINSTFINNTATSNSLGYGGGAVYWSKNSNGYIGGCEFIGNTANGTNAGGQAGAVYWDGVNGTIENTRFVNNTSLIVHNTMGGGAISWNANGGFFNNVTFENNNAFRGGAICGKNAEDLLINNSKFINNTAHTGGVIFLETSENTNFTNTLFENNTATTGDGGCIYFNLNCANSYFDNCTVINNQAFGRGGAIYFSNSNTTVNNSLFISNVANTTDSNSGGGAICYNGNDNKLLNTTFINNSAISKGGAVYWSGQRGLLTNNTFINNSAESGGALTWVGYNGTVTNSTYIGNNATSGGAVYIFNNAYASSSYTTLDNSTFINNTATNGGGINWYGQYGTLKNVTFINNSATNGGGIYWNRAYGNIYNTTYINNSATNGGGAYINANLVNLTNSTFTENNATSGGAIYWYGNAKNMYGTLSNSEFINNNATDGGAIYWLVNGTINNATFTNNSASNRGGAVYMHSWATYSSLHNSTFVNNSAKDGGAVYWNIKHSLLDNSTFINNSASNYGGAIFFEAWDKENITLTKALILNNSAVNRGGGIYFSSNRPYNALNIINSTIEYNKACNGSAIYARHQFGIINSSILNNRANTSSLDMIVVKSGNKYNLTVTLKGLDNILNAIYMEYSHPVYFINTTYWGVNGVRNTGNENISQTALPKPTGEVNQNITIEVYDETNKLILNTTLNTSESGNVSIAGVSSAIDFIGFKAYHLEDNYYTGIVNSSLKDMVTVNITTTNVNFSEIVEINVSVIPLISSDLPSGNLDIYLNNVYYDTVSFTGGNVSFNISNLPVDVYNLKIYYSGDDNFLPEYGYDEFNVSKIVTFITIETTNSSYGDNQTFNVTVPSFVSENIIINVAGKNYTVKIDNETHTGNLTLQFIDAGNHTATAYLHDNRNYYSSTNETNFTISKILSNINVTGENLKNGENRVIIYFEPYMSNGNITIRVNGTRYDKEFNRTLSNSRYTLNLGGLALGTYDIFVEYHDDNNYYASNNTTSFNVTHLIDVKKPTPINIVCQNITYGENETIQITLPKDVSGNLTIEFNNETFVFEIIDGLVEYNITGLTSGNYTINVKYDGDKNYLPNTSSASFIVTKAIPVINIICENITYGENETIIVLINQNGNITITVNDTVYEDILIENNTAILNIPNLNIGNYFVIVNYKGNDNYTNSTANNSFTVNKVSSYINIASFDTFVGENETLIFELPNDATGNITIYINDEEHILPIIQGKANLTLYNLSYNSFNILAFYNGDNKYLESNASNSFNVNKINTNISVKVSSNNNAANIVINLPSDATGNITINLAGKNYTSNIEEGKAVFIISNLSQGVYSFIVYYDGDNKYLNCTYEGNFTISNKIPSNKSNSSINNFSIDLNIYPTGNPFLLLILALILLVSSSFIKFKK